MNNGFLQILAQLRDAGAEFIIVGGVAAALHGGSRVTFDLDIVPSLEPDIWKQTVDFLWSLGARPRIPESIERIQDVDLIRRWREEKGLLALNFRTSDGSTEVDLLVSESDRFSHLRDRAIQIAVEGRTYLVASIDDLIEMKERAGRPQDLFDVTELKNVKARSSV